MPFVGTGENAATESGSRIVDGEFLNQCASITRDAQPFSTGFLANIEHSWKPAATRRDTLALLRCCILVDVHAQVTLTSGLRQAPYKTSAFRSPRIHACPSVSACKRMRSNRPTARPNAFPRCCIDRSHASGSILS